MEHGKLIKNPYDLLLQYKKEASILSTAYKYNEAYYRQMSKYLTYPIVFLSAVASVIASLTNPDLEYVLLGITLATLLFSGFDKVINPKDKEHQSAKISVEFGEISSSINQFVVENSKTNEQIKIFSQKIETVMSIWRGLCPPISDFFINKATMENATRLPRNSLSSKVEKKIELNQVSID